MDMLGAGFQKIEASMIAREKMQGVLSSNIANAETPNYQADQRSFSDFMAEARTSGTGSKAATTNPMHFADVDSSEHMSLNIFQPQHARKLDGNTVDIQKEMVRMSENQLMHELSMRLAKGKLGGLMNAIKEGR